MDCASTIREVYLTVYRLRNVGLYILQENSSKTLPGTCFKAEIMNLQQFLNGMLWFHTDSCDILCNSHNLKSACCKVDVLWSKFFTTILHFASRLFCNWTYVCWRHRLIEWYIPYVWNSNGNRNFISEKHRLFMQATKTHDIPVTAPCKIPLVLTPKPVIHVWIGICLFFVSKCGCDLKFEKSFVHPISLSSFM